MQFARLATYLERLEKTASRLEITSQLATLYQQLELSEVASVTYLLQGRLTPPYESLEFQLSTKSVLRALVMVEAQHGGRDEASVQALFRELGDIGLVAEGVLEAIASSVSPPEARRSLSVLAVFAQLQSIAREAGAGSQERKLTQLTELVTRLDPLSARFLARIVVGKLRLGFSNMTLLDALSWLVRGDKTWAAALERAWEKRVDLGQLATTWLAEVRRLESFSPTPASPSQTEQALSALLENYALQVGVPVMPALCQRLNSAAEIIEKLGEVIAEPKYDGLRLQIHYWRDEVGHEQVRAFSRSLEDMTAMFPELKSLSQVLSGQACILDAEAIGVDPETGKLRSFQETITRKRKHQVSVQAKQIPIRFYLFDLLWLSGESQLEVPLDERKRRLQTLFGFPSHERSESEWSSGVFHLVPFIVTQETMVLQQFHHQVLSAGLEGAVIKQRMSEYRSGRKGWRWVKIKETEGARGKLMDTLDVVVMGYYAGRGKRAQFGLGAILTGLLDREGKVVSVAKIGTGMSEAQLAELKKVGDALAATSRPPLYRAVEKSLEPTVWLEPQLVVEVAADEITRSPAHSSGFALRFPRLVRLRADKTWEQATKLEELSSF